VSLLALLPVPSDKRMIFFAILISSCERYV
jgi:hypothetical protein